MHMLSGKDLNWAELETVRVSPNPITVITAHGEVQKKEEEATVYVNELDLLVTVLLLDDTPAVLSLGKLCEDYGYSYVWRNGKKEAESKRDSGVSQEPKLTMSVILQSRASFSNGKAVGIDSVESSAENQEGIWKKIHW